MKHFVDCLNCHGSYWALHLVPLAFLEAVSSACDSSLAVRSSFMSFDLAAFL